MKNKNTVAFVTIGGPEWMDSGETINSNGHSLHCTRPECVKFYGERFSKDQDDFNQSCIVPELKRFFELNGWEFNPESLYTKDPASMLIPITVFVDKTGSAGNASAFDSFDKVFNGKHYICPNKLYVPYSVAKEALMSFDDKVLNLKLEFRSHGNCSEGNELEVFDCTLHVVSKYEELPDEI